MQDASTYSSHVLAVWSSKEGGENVFAGCPWIIWVPSPRIIRHTHPKAKFRPPKLVADCFDVLPITAFVVFSICVVLIEVGVNKMITSILQMTVLSNCAPPRTPVWHLRIAVECDGNDHVWKSE
eukprot:COSAG02_NODE_26_length_51927_cov_61.213881_16_plen_124_part_00